jgi:TolB-like protein/DNA-binding winged helix-turn-helix (wHTH) protein/Flp pilus assembly protein TadD
MASSAQSKIARFGEFEVDFQSGEIRKKGIKLKIGHQSFNLLAYLLERPGEVVSREEVRQRLWPGNVYVEFDNNLNTAVARLREALDDSAEKPRYIERLPKRGYRFIAKLEGPRYSRPRLLVLPFLNLRGELSQEYVSDAMTEELVGALAGLAPDRLAVIARTTSMFYKGARQPLQTISRDVGADWIIEGSVAGTQGKWVVSVQLIRCADETHRWAERYEIELHELVNVANEAALAIADQLGISPVVRTRKAHADPAAYNCYILGRHHLLRGTPEDLSRAMQLFKDATERDAGFALAYDGLAEVYWYLVFFGFCPLREIYPAAMHCALRALEIDSALAETHALIVMFRSGFDFCWEEVDRHMARALELDPASPFVRIVHALLEMIYGHIEQATTYLRSVLESDPRNLFARAWFVLMLCLGHEYDRAIEEARILLSLDPTNYMGHTMIGFAYREKGFFPEAIAAYRKTLELSGGSPLSLGWLALALGQAGEAAEARTILQRLHAIAGQHYVPPTSLAWAHIGLGETDEALLWMEKAIESGDLMMGPIRTYPFLDPIRDDPRFLAILRKLNPPT